MCVVQLPWTIKFVCRMIGQNLLNGHMSRMVALMLSMTISITANILVIIAHYDNEEKTKPNRFDLIFSVIIMLLGVMMAEAVLELHGEFLLRDLRNKELS